MLTQLRPVGIGLDGAQQTHYIGSSPYSVRASRSLPGIERLRRSEPIPRGWQGSRAGAYSGPWKGHRAAGSASSSCAVPVTRAAAAAAGADIHQQSVEIR